jgi:hypothetical protein
MRQSDKDYFEQPNWPNGMIYVLLAELIWSEAKALNRLPGNKDGSEW